MRCQSAVHRAFLSRSPNQDARAYARGRSGDGSIEVPFPNASTDFYRLPDIAAPAVQNDRRDYVVVTPYCNRGFDLEHHTVTPINLARQNEAVFVVNDRGGSCRI